MNRDFLDSLTASHRQSMDAMKADIAASNKRAEVAKTLLHQKEEDSAVSDVVRAEGPWVSPSAEKGAVQLLREQFKMVDGKVIVVDGQGNKVVGPNGPLAPSEIVKRFKAEHQNFVRQANTPATKENAISDEFLKTLFGPTSKGGAAQKFVTERGIDAYRSHRATARERGIF